MRVLLLCTVLLSCTSGAWGAPISLTAALRSGLENHPGHLAVKAETDVARAAAAVAASQKLPRLSLTENLVYTNEPGGSLFISLNQQRSKAAPR